MPKTMPRMTKEGEARLPTALDAVVDLVNEGKDPDDAFVQGGVRTLDPTTAADMRSAALASRSVPVRHALSLTRACRLVRAVARAKSSPGGQQQIDRRLPGTSGRSVPGGC